MPRGSAPVAAPAAPAPSPATLDLDEIRAALDAISAQFNLQEGTLTAEQEAAKRAFDFLRSQFGEAREEALESVKSSAAGRGLLRSGLFLRASGQISEDFATQQARAQAERDARLRAIAGALTGLGSQESATRSAEARRLAREQVGTKEAIARALQLV